MKQYSTPMNVHTTQLVFFPGVTRGWVDAPKAVAQPGSDLGDGITIEHFTFSSAGTHRPLGIVSIVTQRSRRV